MILINVRNLPLANRERHTRYSGWRKSKRDSVCAPLLSLAENDEEPLQEWKTNARVGVAQRGTMRDCLLLSEAQHFSTTGNDAMSIAATLERFSIMSTQGRALKCSAGSFKCTSTRP